MLRETSSVTTHTVLGYVREIGGERAVQAVLEAAALPDTPEELSDVGHWVSYDSRIRLFEATAAHFGDPQVMYEAGRSSMRQTVAPSVVLAMRSLGSPAVIYSLLPSSIAKYSTTSTMVLVDSDDSSATFRFSLHDGYVHSRLDCLYAQGLLASIPESFDLPPARIAHDECESDGAPACRYDVTWSREAPAAGGGADSGLAMENAALRRQLTDLRSAAADLVGGDDLRDVLQRVVERAASAVVARGYLLVVRDDHGQPIVHRHGVSAEEAEQVSADLLAGTELGSSAVVVSIASTRRHHGWLAALHGQAIPGDREALRGYARHAAAALDMVSALADSRRDAARARALLDLAHRLADADRPQQIAHVVAEKLTTIVGSQSGGVLLWDESAGLLRAVAAHTPSLQAQVVMETATASPADMPELADLLVNTEPQVHTIGDVSPALTALMRATEIEHLLVMPLRSAGRFYGVITGSWAAVPDTRDVGSDLMQRLQAVADQAATALRNAQLTADVRHQAEHDDLTGLPNRRLFLRQLEQELDSAVAGTGVLFCDLDGFKGVNDRHGHAAGDELLRQVARRLGSVVREEDRVGRLSGDEFATLLPGLEDLAEAQLVAERVVASLAAPFTVDGEHLHVTASVGIAAHSGRGGDAGQLLRQADQAMYVAKQRGRNQVVSFLAASVPAPRPALRS